MSGDGGGNEVKSHIWGLPAHFIALGRWVFVIAVTFR